MRALMLVCIGFLVLAPCLQTGGHGIPGAHSEGYISDVIVVDLQCEENQTCVSRASNIVEYFGADWCTECPDVEQTLKQAPNQSEIIISHRPSSTDDFWLNESRNRFLDVYGLWGYPTIALDGHYILAGPTQSKQLNSLLSESDSNYSGVTNVTLDGNNITLLGNFTNKSIDIWTVSSTENLTNMAINHTNYSETNIVDTNGEKLIIVVSHPGYIALISGSDSPVNNYNPDGGLFATEDNDVNVAGSTIIIITILLLMISLPATIQLVQLMREKPVYTEEE